MELTHKFTVPASLKNTWAAFNDIEGVAGCFPGASVTSVEGDEFRGTVKVKLGPISLTYNGSGAFTEKDESARRFVVEAKGKDRRGNGTASAVVTASMSSSAEASTDVEVLTDLTITGRPAQFGRGVIQDVSDKLLQQFMTCLEQRLSGPAPEAAAAPPAAGEAEAEHAPGAEVPAAGPPVAGSEAATPSPQAPSAPEAPEAPAAAAAPETGTAAPETGTAAPEAGEAPAAPETGSVEAEAAAEAEAAVGRAAEGPETVVSGGPMGNGAGPATEGVVTAPLAAGPDRVDVLDLGATVLPVLARRYWKSALAAVASLVGIILLVRLVRRR